MVLKGKLLAVAISAILLSACGGTEHTIVKVDPPTQDNGNDNDGHDDHDHGDAITDANGRLIVTSADSNVVNVYSTADKSLIDSIGVTHYPKYVYSSENHRFAVLVQRDQGLVEFIDGGLYEEEHGDHHHIHEEAPALASFHLESVKPTHVTVGESGIAVFSDGDKDSQQNAGAAMFTEAHISGEQSEVAALHYDTYMHGAAQARGEFLISTIRDPQTETSLPSQIGLYHAHGDHFHQEQVFNVSCPALHGSAQNEEAVAFGCGDGVALITQQGESFSAVKLANPDYFADGQRIGTLKGHHDAEQFIASAGNDVLMVDPEHGHIEKLEWQVSDNYRIASFGFSFAGEHVVVMDTAGKLSIFAGHDHDGEHHFEAAGEVQVSDADLTTMPEGHGFQITFSHSEQAVYVSDPIAKQIKKFDLEEAKLVDTFELDYVPEKLVWLGIAAEESHDH
ncbi:YncE family protein [Pseudoalteromonas maricaloris]|uniref:YncE family protein n=1 Tax=Pseudoalteromonas maricaloris TaxID=184924 RepID=UPI00057D7F1E|nr:hypothetical protein [Pseudoalteromonas flavipulchra]KID33856.1 hypothetical protein QT15_19480 [Pseudoalteromonas flavipulchra NCIMB 2033 = ATCC BAA-314]MBD0782234.1 hypothetical protein [Pseudoalteromonas flavipulchra]MBE0375959.1 hypothetical protein [Pseudoalteromonas flavipulchra NCIMB 2033 = ATCC BAA-314]